MIVRPFRQTRDAAPVCLVCRIEGDQYLGVYLPASTLLLLARF